MSTTASFIYRNPVFCAQNVRTVYAVIKAMKEYRKEHPICEYTKTLPTKFIHHIKPVHLFPELAADKTNFISFGSHSIHLVVGHGGNFKYWIDNVRAICELSSTPKKVQ